MQAGDAEHTSQSEDRHESEMKRVAQQVAEDATHRRGRPDADDETFEPHCQERVPTVP